MQKTLLTLFCLTIIFCPSIFAENKNDNEVGTFQLITVNNGEKEELYRINTKTGEVWIFGEFVVLDEKQLNINEEAKESLRKLIEQAKKQGKNVYTLPYWQLTDEKPSEIYTVH